MYKENTRNEFTIDLLEALCRNIIETYKSTQINKRLPKDGTADINIIGESGRGTLTI